MAYHEAGGGESVGGCYRGPTNPKRRFRVRVHAVRYDAEDDLIAVRRVVGRFFSQQLAVLSGRSGDFPTPIAILFTLLRQSSRQFGPELEQLSNSAELSKPLYNHLSHLSDDTKALGFM